MDSSSEGDVAQSREGRARELKCSIVGRRAARQSLARPVALCAPNWPAARLSEFALRILRTGEFMV